MVSLLLSKWRLVAYSLVFMVALCGFFYVRNRLSLVEQLENELQQSRAINAVNLSEVAEIKQAYRRQLEALEHERAGAASIAAKIQQIKKESANAEDAPVAPILRAVIDGLREPANAD